MPQLVEHALHLHDRPLAFALPPSSGIAARVVIAVIVIDQRRGLGACNGGLELRERGCVAARKIVEIANTVEASQDGRIHIEKINGPFLFQLKATPPEYRAGLDRAIANGWLVLRESGTFVRFTQAGADLFA
jgi:hypothetical protein